MLYEKLNPQMREAVDEFATRLRPLPWKRKSDLLAEAGAPFGARFTGDEARLASLGFITAVLERLEPSKVDDPYMACLLDLSLNPEHRQLASGYLSEHPEIRQLLDGEDEHGGH